MISAVNATVRKTFDISSNAWLEVQWYLFAAVFLLAAGYTLLNDEHVRIDVISAACPSAPDLDRHARLPVFLLPVCLIILWYGRRSSCRVSVPARCLPTPAG